MKFSSYIIAIITVSVAGIRAQSSRSSMTTTESSLNTAPVFGADFRCTKTTAVVGELLKENLDTMKAVVTTTIAIKLNVGETACIRVHFPETGISKSTSGSANVSLTNANNETDNVVRNLNGTVLFLLQYVGLRQIYPIRQQYTFAVPQFESKCICDCSGGENHCAIGYNYRNCSKQAYCVTTYHPHQKATGCFAGEEAELCCDVTVTPYQNMKFEAVHLTQPSTAGKFAYKVYVLNNGEWITKKSEIFQVPLNHDHRMEFNDDKLEMQISGTKSYWQLDSGMYFYEIDSQSSKSKQLRTGVPINEMYEWNTGKLGWFRMQDNHWTVANGLLEIQDAHHVQVEHCKDQLYTVNYKAHYYTSVGKNKTAPAISLGPSSGERTGVYLGRTVTETEPWIDYVVLPDDSSDEDNDRQIVVVTRESPSITVHMNLDSQVELRLYYHKSDLKDFTGLIQLDKYSNKYLNLTLIDAKGTLLGAMYKSESKTNTDLAFSANVDERSSSGSGTVVNGNTGRSINSTFILILPSTVNSTRYVCLRPSEKTVDLCKWIEYRSVPLEHVDITREWSLNQGECPGCNEMTWNSFLSYLNPKQWFDGISSVSEAFAMIVEIAFYIVVVVIFIAVCRRCVCPLLRALLCAGGNSGSSKNKSDS